MDTDKLRQKILDLAIHGKLVPQDPNDEPASVLLERIKAEKEKLIKEGKIKRSKKTTKHSDTPYYENVPFEIPKNWVWIKLSDIAYFGGGKTPSMKEKRYWLGGKNLWVTSKDMKYDRIYDSLMKVSDEALSMMTLYDPGTLLMVTRSGILKHTLPIAILEKRATVNQDLRTISLYLSDIAEYIYFAIKANEKYILKECHKDGTTVDSINFEKFVDILLPLPPENELQRLISVLKKWFEKIESIEIDKKQLLSAIDYTKTKILDLAIHGKLVPQDPNDEPAIELLKRIKPDFTPCDNAHYGNVPYEIPKNWYWVRHNDAMEISGGSQPPKSYFKSKPEEGYIRLYQIRDYGDTPIPVYIPIDLVTKTTNKGDILLARYGGSLGKVFIAEDGAYNVAMAKVIVKYKGLICNDYLYYYYLSSLYQDMLKLISRTAQAGFNSTDFEDMFFPLPPIQEQQRIAQAIKLYYDILDGISANL